MKNIHLVHLWRQMQIHPILTHVCLHQIGCLYYCCYAKTSSPAAQIRHSKVYGNPIDPSLYSILLGVQCTFLYTILCSVQLVFFCLQCTASVLLCTVYSKMRWNKHRHLSILHFQLSCSGHPREIQLKKQLKFY